jgi:transcriptional regulator with XRE-family HTH domain
MSALSKDLQDKALQLLGDNIGLTQVAAALGITPSAISQLISDDEEFAAAVQARKLAKLELGNNLDAKYDALESKLLDKLERTVAFEMNPVRVSAILSRVNAAKRRNSSTAPTDLVPQDITTISMPTVIVNNMQVNVQGQVVSVDEKEIITANKTQLARLLLENIPNSVLPHSDVLDVQMQDVMQSVDGENNGKVINVVESRSAEAA